MAFSKTLCSRVDSTLIMPEFCNNEQVMKGFSPEQNICAVKP